MTLYNFFHVLVSMSVEGSTMKSYQASDIASTLREWTLDAANGMAEDAVVRHLIERGHDGSDPITQVVIDLIDVEGFANPAQLLVDTIEDVREQVVSVAA
uniref:Uncharacterized protein n=1 Tax=Siphoviridae sp. ctDyb2 TaxID=2826201 RepID=A0A8S5MCJ0_9CAUD|nr:MAG TPA: hypothetical protein [Siphoviridae sp. ctDyb2]